jgi:hypothetical protein
MNCVHAITSFATATVFQSAEISGDTEQNRISEEGEADGLERRPGVSSLPKSRSSNSREI